MQTLLQSTIAKRHQEEFYLNLLTGIYRKEERELLEHPGQMPKRLEVLGQFSNEVQHVARVLARKYEQGSR